jgi:hypothetical protein
MQSILKLPFPYQQRIKAAQQLGEENLSKKTSLLYYPHYGE